LEHILNQMADFPANHVCQPPRPPEHLSYAQFGAASGHLWGPAASLRLGQVEKSRKGQWNVGQQLSQVVEGLQA